MRFGLAFLICMTFVFAIPLAMAQDYQPAGEEWITKWWALDGLITNTGGHVASAAVDWLSEGTGGRLTDQSASTMAGLLLTRDIVISLPDNGGDLGWTIITIDPEDSHNSHNALGLPEADNYEYYGIIVIDSPDARTTTMHPTHDDYGHIWLNGDKVYDNPEWTTGATLVTTPTEVSLAKGQNVLLFRFGESGGDDYMNLHFEASDDDLKVLPTMDDKLFEFIDAGAPVEPRGKVESTWGDVKE